VKTARARMIFDCLRKVAQAEGAGLTDGQLLRQYFAHRDEAAFAVLVRRHGAMVLAVCRRLLRRAEDAEDAFQAAFVVLVRPENAILAEIVAV
jgi:Sigma-70 region 2